MPWNFRIGGAALVSLALSGAVSGDEGSVPRMDPGSDPLPSGAVLASARRDSGMAPGSEILFRPDGKS